jgi:hypothetical protein
LGCLFESRSNAELFTAATIELYQFNRYFLHFITKQLYKSCFLVQLYIDNARKKMIPNPNLKKEITTLTLKMDF